MHIVKEATQSSRIEGTKTQIVDALMDKESLAPAPELRDAIEMACYKHGLIILGCGPNSIRWSPPLILAKEHVDVALEIFDEAIAVSI